VAYQQKRSYTNEKRLSETDNGGEENQNKPKVS
jgi:hypothetical protein